MSRFESNLVAAISDERDIHKYWMLRLRHAAYNARLGNTEYAREVIESARSALPQMNTAQMVSYINFAEGVCDYFESGAAKAIDKLSRSRVLSVGCPPNDDLPLLVSAWLAAVHRALGQWDNLFHDLIDIFVSKRSVTDEVAVRACLVVADSWEEIEDTEMADKWYKAARECALRLGDDSSLGAILYNRAAIRVFNMRIREIRGFGLDIDECHIIVQTASAENYAHYVKDTSLGWVFDLLFGQLAMLKGQYEEAVHRLTSMSIPANLEADWPSAELMRVADLLRCRAMLGEINEQYVSHQISGPVDRLLNEASAGGAAIALYSIQCALSAIHCQSDKYKKMSMEAIVKFDHMCNQESKVLKGFLERAAQESTFRI